MLVECLVKSVAMLFPQISHLFNLNFPVISCRIAYFCCILLYPPQASEDGSQKTEALTELLTSDFFMNYAD